MVELEIYICKIDQDLVNDWAQVMRQRGIR